MGSIRRIGEGSPSPKTLSGSVEDDGSEIFRSLCSRRRSKGISLISSCWNDDELFGCLDAWLMGVGIGPIGSPCVAVNGSEGFGFIDKK
jgi:hypothetical protein